MTALMTRRMMMVALGALAGLSLYALTELAQTDLLPQRLTLAALVLAATFFGGVLILTGPLRPARAALGAVGIAALLVLLLTLASLRFSTLASLAQPHILLPALVLASLPMPFWIAASLGSWRDYATLFTEAWSITVRYAIGWAFAGIVWAVIFLSDAFLGIVGVHVLGDLIDLAPVPWLVTGAVLGLGLGVVQEMQDSISPVLLLRMLRLILPVVLVVTAVFLLALPLRGVSGLFDGVSVALVMLAVVGLGATLVTTAVDQDDPRATTSALLLWSARAMALLLPVLALVGGWALWLRVAQHGWTPQRLFAAQVAVLGLGYGLLYAAAVLRGAGWMGRIRRANVAMALAVLGTAALNLTPILNAEAISTRSHLARFTAGTIGPQDLDALALGRWGHAGDEALARLRERAAEPGQEALRALLDAPGTSQSDTGALIEAARAALPLQPASATATRDLFLADFDADALRRLIASCETELPGGGPGCVMVVADLLPTAPGEEALLVQWQGDGFAQFEGLVQGRPRFAPIVRAGAGAGAGAGDGAGNGQTMGGDLPFGEAAASLIRDWQAVPPAIEPAPVNRLSGSGIMVLD